MASKMKFNPRSSWLSLKLGWKLLKMLRNTNMFSLLRLANLHLFIALDLPTPPLLPLPSISQNLNLIGYIKNQKVIILIDSGNTHNFIHRHISQETHFYIHAVNNVDIMISNGGSMKCGGCR
jgi:hypothetical protein